jgi:uncharacterized repeat protein (TIGR01451 family)
MVKQTSASTSAFSRAASRAAEGFLRVLGRATASARFVVDTPRVHNKALVLGLLMLAPTAWAATPPGTAVTNIATASYQVSGTPITRSGAVTITTAARTPAVVEFLTYAPTGGMPTVVQATQCSTSGGAGGPFVPSSGPTLLPMSGGGTLAVPGTYSLIPTTLYTGGEPVFVRVTDHDQNLNPLLTETIVTTLTLPGGDSETLQLTETGPSTGVFVGYIQSVSGTPTAHDCLLSFAPNLTVTASYTDVADGTDSANDAALVDPLGTVFDSASGAPVNSASVTLIDTATNLPATVYGDDGVSTYPATVLSGGTVTDSGSTVYAFPPGGYRFPQIPPGTYRLQITPPAGYGFPSTVPPASLPGSYTVVGVPGSGASYGGDFPLNPGPAVRIDVPLDPGGGSLQITKIAGKSVVGVGDFLPYTLDILNSSPTAVTGVQIADRLPLGFRYMPGSARLNGAALADPVISSDGRTLTFGIGNLAVHGKATLRYVAQVTAGAQTGTAENTAYATGGLVSNTARASVNVREDLMRSKAILMGRVVIGSCDNRVDNDENSLTNARIVLEDGTTLLTDEHGRWHADNIVPGTHVVQLDLNSLPPDYAVLACEKNARFAGRSYSQFVNVRGGSLWRADFHVQKKTPEAVRLTQQLSASREQDKVRVTLVLEGGATVNSLSATLMLPDAARLVAGSARLNGAATDKLDGADGMLILRTGKHEGTWRDTLTLELAAPTSEVLKLVSMVRFVPPDQQGVNLPKAEVALAAKPVLSSAEGPVLSGAEGPVLSGAEGPVNAQAFALIPPTMPHLESPNVPGTVERGRRTLPIAQDGIPQVPGSDDRNRLVEQLPYDANWLAQVQPGVEWLHPQQNFQPALPAIKVAVKHVPGQQLTLKVNGVDVDPLKFDGMEQNATRSVGLSQWRGVNLKEGDNTLQLVVTDANGKEVLNETRRIHYSYGPDSARIVPELSRLIADGKTRPVIAVRFLDRDGHPVRRGVNGEFQLNAPYQSATQLEAIQRDPLAGKVDNRPRYEIGRDGIALIELAPTTQSGEVKLGFALASMRGESLNAWIEAGQRDWILVGFAEGSVGHKQISGNMQSAQQSGAEDDLFDGNRIAFYAKGTIKGEYLLTAAYDTAKQNGYAGARTNLFQSIDPTRYYTLYADATQPMFDAASASKLYLKIERRQFYALFGDYDTGLTVTEFSRYSRSLTGLKSEYRGERFAYNAFASETSQAFVKDEIRGDGTSGLYRLSRGNIVGNSDKITIESRDRFHSQVVVSSQTLTRYLDYDINYLQGTLFFKKPIPGRDPLFNPVYIMAEYEADDSSDKALTGGGRASFKPTVKSEVGLSYIHQGTAGDSGNLGGMDFTYLVSDKTRIQGEYAHSDSEVLNNAFSGNAWKIEALHQSDTLDARVYARQQDTGFGFGQQANSETGTRKIGAEARLKLSDTLQLQGQAYQQDTFQTDAQRNVVEGRVESRLNDHLTGYLGGLYARDQYKNGDTLDSKQVLAGLSYEMLDRKLTLRAATEFGLGSDDAKSVDFPNRLLLGADYKLTEQTKLFAEQEFARGENLSANMTRVGMRVQPWTGGEMAASVGNQSALDRGRIYADLGLVQKWQINEFWQTDFAIDRSQTLKLTAPPLNPQVPLTSGSITGDYTAVSVGANYNNSVWGANSRIEWRGSDLDRRVNALLGVQRLLDAGQVVAAGVAYTDTDGSGSQSRKLDARLSYAWRPWDSEWVWLDRLDYIDELTQDAAGKVSTRKLVNNFNANWMPNRQTQIALQYGSKYVLDTIDSAAYRGYTDLIGAEARRDLTEKWDVGVAASMLQTWNSSTKQTSLGASLGYELMENTVITVGYNYTGFDDPDFSGAEYRVQGPYAAIRIKVDQDTLKLNDKKGGLFASNP